MIRSVVPLLAFYTVQTLACPSLTQSSSVYTEVAVGCKVVDNVLQADLSVPASVNQRDNNGGECRVQNESGEQFFVDGNFLVIKDANGAVKKTVGSLTAAPSCTKVDDNNSPGWTAVSVFDTNPAPPITPQAESRMEKVVCYAKVKGAFYRDDGVKQDEFDDNYKNSETLLKIWQEGGVEYRTTEGTALRTDGSTQYLWRSFSTRKETVQGDLTVETYDSNVVRNWTADYFPSPDKRRVQYKKNVSETTWRSLGNGQSQEIKFVMDGKEKRSGGTRTITKSDDGSRTEKFVEQTPYREDFEGGSYTILETSESTCTYTPVQ